MMIFEKLDKILKESNNSNFHFDKLDWVTRVAISSLCEILDKELENLKRNL